MGHTGMRWVMQGCCADGWGMWGGLGEVGYGGVGWVMQGWGGSCWSGVGHEGMGWVMQG